MTKRELTLYIAYIALIFTVTGCVSVKTFKRGKAESFKAGVQAGEEKKDKECFQTIQEALERLNTPQDPIKNPNAPAKRKRIAKKPIVAPCQ